MEPTSEADEGVRPLTLMTPNEFRAEMKRKGWTFVELAERWCLSANWLARVATRVDRPRYWDDAVRGLPDQTKQPRGR